MEWHLLGCAAGGAVLVRGADVRDHPQSHLQILPIEDARLMMASRDLLAALKVAAPAYCSLHCPSVFTSPEQPRHTGQCDALQAAITKAEGR